VSFRALLLILLIPQPLIAGPPALPDFVVDYLNSKQLGFELPRGQFERYLLEILECQNDPEPWAMSGDFNGDDLSDWAGLLRDREGQLSLVVVYSLHHGYSHKILASLGSDGDSLDSYVVLEPPGRLFGFPLRGEHERPELDLANSAVHLFYFEKASVLYYWADGSFREFVTGD